MINIEIEIKDISPNEDNHYKIKNMVETLAGVIRAHLPHSRFSLKHMDYLDNQIVAHKLHFGPHKTGG